MRTANQKDDKQQPKNKLKSHIKRTKSDPLLEQPLKKRKVLSQIRPTSDKHRNKGSPVSNNNIHTQLKRDKDSGKLFFLLFWQNIPGTPSQKFCNIVGCALVHSVYDLRTIQKKRQCSLIRQLKLYKF